MIFLAFIMFSSAADAMDLVRKLSDFYLFWENVFFVFFRGFSWFQAFLCLIWALNSHQTMPRPPRLDIYNKKYIRTKFWQPSGALSIYLWNRLSPTRGQNTLKSFRRKTSEITQIRSQASFWGPLTYMDLTGLCFHARLAIDSKTVLTGTHFTHSKHTFKSTFTHWQTVANRGLMMPGPKTTTPTN